MTAKGLASNAFNAYVCCQPGSVGYRDLHDGW